MIQVKQLSRHLFAVDLSGDQLSLIQDAAAESLHDESGVLFALLYSVLRVDDKNILPERSQDGVEGKNAGMGRR